MGDDALGDSSGWYSQRHSRSRAPSVKKKDRNLIFTSETSEKNEVDVYKLLNNHVQIRPRKHVMSVRWNTLVKILGLYWNYSNSIFSWIWLKTKNENNSQFQTQNTKYRPTIQSNLMHWFKLLSPSIYINLSFFFSVVWMCTWWTLNR